MAREDQYAKEREFEKEVSEETRRIQFSSQKRGLVFSYLVNLIAIAEAPKGDKDRVTRKEAQTLDSVLDKLWNIDDTTTIETMPDHVMLDESEWKFLKEKVEVAVFPRWTRAIRQFMNDVIDNTEKVDVEEIKPGNEPA